MARLNILDEYQNCYKVRLLNPIKKPIKRFQHSTKNFNLDLMEAYQKN